MRKPNRTPPNHMLLLPHSALHCQTICCGRAQWRVCLQAVVHIKKPPSSGAHVALMLDGQFSKKLKPNTLLK